MAGTPGEPVPQGQPLPPGASGPGDPQGPGGPEADAGRPIWLIVLLSAVGVLVVAAVLIGLYLSERGDDGEPGAEPTPTETEEEPATEPEPEAGGSATSRYS